VQISLARLSEKARAVNSLALPWFDRLLMPVWVFSAGSLKGGVCLALYRLPVINGLSMFSSMKVTITSWPMRAG